MASTRGHNHIFQRVRQLPGQWQLVPNLWRGLGVIGLIITLWNGYVLTSQPITLVINDQAYPLRTHRLTVAGVVEGLGLTLEPEDRVQPSLSHQLAAGDIVTIQLARPVSIEADGQTWRLLTHQQIATEVLAEAGVLPAPHDEILINGLAVDPTSPLPVSQLTPPTSGQTLFLAMHTPRAAMASTRPEGLQLIVRRAVPITLHEGQINHTFYTTQPNVGEALLEQGLTLFLGDRVTPPQGTRLAPGMHIYIQRSTPVTLIVDGRSIQTRTLRRTVGEVLAQVGVALMGQDFTRPPAGQAIAAHEAIEVVRVRETVEIEQELIPFETTWIPDEAMELDQQEVRQPGITGVIKSRTRVRYENEQEVERHFEDEWLDQEPQDRVIAYGTNIVIRTLDTPDGPIEYWRRISMVATPYNAASSGKSFDHPQYGITRTGLRVGFGMAAVDPKVIPLMTYVYVPGYGRALTADTGGLIVGKHIDLAYDDNQPMPDLYGWLDVYVLTPVPPADQIRYVLPEWPQR